MSILKTGFVLDHAGSIWPASGSAERIVVNVVCWDILPSGELTYLWKITIFNGKIHYKWPFSIAMLNYQRLTAGKVIKLFFLMGVSNVFPLLWLLCLMTPEGILKLTQRRSWRSTPPNIWVGSPATKRV